MHLHLKSFGGTLKWPLKRGSRLIEVTATAGLTVLLTFIKLPIVIKIYVLSVLARDDLCVPTLYNADLAMM